MFENQLVIYGKHAELLKKFSRDKQGLSAIPFTVTDNEGNKKDIVIFESYIQCYMIAALLGIYNKKTIPEDPKRSIDATIFVEALSKYRGSLNEIVETMILVDEDKNNDRKIKQAFAIQRENGLELERKLTSYARGGLEILDEWFGKCDTYEGVVNQFLLFAQDLEDN